MQNFIQTSTGSWISIASIEMAEVHDDIQMQIRTPVGRFLVKKADFNKIAGITPASKKKVLKK